MPHARIINRLWRARKESGLSQQEVAFLLELKSTAQISRWEKGKRIPSTTELLKLSAIYSRLANDLMWDLYLQVRRRVNQRYEQLNAQKEAQLGKSWK